MAKKPECDHPGYKRIRLPKPEKHFGRWYFMEECRNCGKIFRARTLNRREREKRNLD